MISLRLRQPGAARESGITVMLASSA